MSIAYLSIGSNLGDRSGNIRDCIADLETLGKVLRASSLFETEPMEFVSQPWFLNCAVSLETALTPYELLTGIQAIEADLGRNRALDKGPRTIDIDILLFDDLIVTQTSLKIPHPAMSRRRFVLEPLREIAPDAFDPQSKKTVAQMLAELDEAGGQVWRLAR
jgi:2-amino-4-hydroxy-6-hydroxymethyldihydropteridine diphosphokinase